MHIKIIVQEQAIKFLNIKKNLNKRKGKHIMQRKKQRKYNQHINHKVTDVRPKI